MALPPAEDVGAEFASVSPVFPDYLLPGEDRLPQLVVGTDASNVAPNGEKRSDIIR